MTSSRPGISLIFMSEHIPGFVACLFGSGSFQLNGRAIDDVGSVGKASFSLFKLLESHESEAPAK